MFGHTDKTDQDNDNPVITPSSAPEPPQSGDQSWQHTGAPLNDDSNSALPGSFTAPSEPAAEAEPATDADTTANLPSAPATTHDDTSPSGSSDIIDDTPVDHDLIDIKLKALNQLSPLVGHLDQQPEERFRTLMMMIQASDDQSLIKDAYEAAQKINDEKAKAQALLDVVNEINYFSSQK